MKGVRFRLKARGVGFYRAYCFVLGVQDLRYIDCSGLRMYRRIQLKLPAFELFTTTGCE